MKLVFSKEELFGIVKRSFPPEMIPLDHEVVEVEETGPSYAKEITITISQKKGESHAL
jgi:hypothetical protein